MSTSKHRLWSWRYPQIEANRHFLSLIHHFVLRKPTPFSNNMRGKCHCHRKSGTCTSPPLNDPAAAAARTTPFIHENPQTIIQSEGLNIWNTHTRRNRKQVNYTSLILCLVYAWVLVNCKHILYMYVIHSHHSSTPARNACNAATYTLSHGPNPSSSITLKRDTQRCIIFSCVRPLSLVLIYT